MMRLNLVLCRVLPALIVAGVWTPAVAEAPDQTAVAVADGAQELLEFLDAPLLFVKRHSYAGIHIYDTYYKGGSEASDTACRVAISTPVVS